MSAADTASAVSTPALADTHNHAVAGASDASASSGINASTTTGSAGDESPSVDSDALTAAQLAALASKTLHGGADQPSDALTARYTNL